jgi:hypothetical protein
MTDYAFVAAGRLHVSTGGGAPRALESSFAQTVRGRAQEIQRRHSWKGEGSQGGFGALAWGRAQTGPASVDARVVAVTRGAEPDEVLYALEVDRLTAVCAARLATASERRLLHGSKAKIRGLCARADRDEVACAVVHDDGTAAIALMSRDAADLREVTEGESLDLAPAWADDGSPRIVYQAAGLGRDGAGRPAGYGRFEIHVVDLARGEVETLAADASADLERPRIGADGSLYYLSRPHRAARGSALATAKDALLFPARLLYAVFQYLNFFSARYTGKPLTTAGGPRGKSGDLRRMLQWANLVEAQGDPAAEADEGAVPRTHRLVRRRPDGGQEVVAHGVACYDLAADGSVLYGTGSAIYRVARGGAPERLADAGGVDSIVFL